MKNYNTRRLQCKTHMIMLTMAVLAGLLILNPSLLKAKEYIIGLGDVPGGDYRSIANEVSSDGRVVAGRSSSNRHLFEAFRWTETEGIQGLGFLYEDLESRESGATAISSDGNVIIGNSKIPTSDTNHGHMPFRWTQSNGINELYVPPSEAWSMYGHDLSDDGSVVIFSSNDGQDSPQSNAYRWTDTNGTQRLDFSDKNAGTFATDMSNDGNVVVGRVKIDGVYKPFRWTEIDGMKIVGELEVVRDKYLVVDVVVSGDGNTIAGDVATENGHEAFIWTESGGMQGLGDLPGGEFYSQVVAISDDGTTVVGFSAVGRREDDYGDMDHAVQAFRWTESEGMQGLGFLPNGQVMSKPMVVSADGKIIIGIAENENGKPLAFYWTVDNQMSTIDSILAKAKIDTSGWKANYFYVWNMTPDGKFLVGDGFSDNGTEAFRIEIPQKALLNLANLNKSIDGIHHVKEMSTHAGRSLVQSSLPDIQSGFSLSPVFSYVKGSDISSVGTAVNYGYKKIYIQGKAGITKAEDDLSYGGKADFDGYWFGLGLSSTLGAITGTKSLTPLEVSANTIIGHYDANIDRQYINVSTPETSNGNTDIESISALIRVGWKQQIGESFSLTPYGQLLYTSTKIDAYTEKGGTFPCSVDEQKNNNTEYSLGATLNWAASDSINFSLKAAWVTIDNTGESINVNVANASGINISTGTSPSYNRTWTEYGVGASFKLTKRIGLSGEVGGTSGSDYPEEMHCQISFKFEI